MRILYEDNHIIVVVKEYNIPVMEDESKDMDMLTMIKSYIKEKYNKPGNVYLGLVHRLDRPVGGVMVFAKTSKAASRLSEQIRTSSIEKHYVALTHNKAKDSDILVDYLEKDCKTNTSFIHDYKTRTFKHVNVNGYNLKIIYKKRRYVCKSCNKRFPESNTFIDRYAKISNQLNDLLLKNLKEKQTFKQIAKNNNVDYKLLAALNGLNVNDYIYPNQTIMIPKKEVSLYITKEGDTLSSVTKSLNANLEAIINQNRRIYLLPEQLIVYKKK